MSRALVGLVSLSLLALGLAVLGTGCAAEIDLEDEVGQDGREIVNGTVTDEFPATGMLILGDSPDEGMIGCSVTLIGCDTVLTAAHCVCAGFGADCPNGAPLEPLHVFFPSAGFFPVASVATHPSYNEYIEHDAAVLRLATPVTGVDPVPVASTPITPGTPAIIVGYGRTGGEVYEYGIKRQGDVVTTACDEELGVNKLCWRFDGSAEASASNVCHGDSGGSTYVVRDGRVEIVGVHSTTNQMSCLEAAGTYPSADTGVFDHRDFISSAAAGGLAQDACGDLPQVGGAGAQLIADSGAINVGQAAELTVEVPRGTAELRVALNSTDGAGANLDLYVRGGEPASAQQHDCSAAGPSAHGFCTLRSPAPGTWYIQVVADPAATSRGGDYQVTATVLSGAPLGADDTYDVAAGDTTAVAAGDGVLANDQGTARGPLSAAVDTPPAHGQLELAADGSFQYTPEPGFTGTDTFTYRASDGAYQGQAVVTLRIGAGPGGGTSLTGGCAAGGGGATGGGALLLLFAAALLGRRRAS